MLLLLELLSRRLSPWTKRPRQARLGTFRCRRTLARTFYNLGNTQNEPKDARKWYEKAQKLLQSLEKVGKLTPPDQYAGWLKELEGAITFTRSAEKSVSGLDYALKQPADKVHILLTVRGAVLARRGKDKEAAITAEKNSRKRPSRQTQGCSMMLAVFSRLSRQRRRIRPYANAMPPAR